MTRKQFSYVTDNFEPYNRAIEADIRRHDNLSRALISQARVNKSLMILRWAGAAAMLIIAISIAIWLLTTLGTVGYDYSTAISRINVEDAARKVQESSPSQDPMIKTSFTVFETAVTDTGERVVTGRVYDPQDFDFPVSQYCYLEIRSDKLGEQIQNTYDAVTKDLAKKEAKGKVETVVTDEALSLTATTYCRFI